MKICINLELLLGCYRTMHLRLDGCVTPFDLMCVAVEAAVVVLIIVGQQARMITSAAPDRPTGAGRTLPEWACVCAWVSVFVCACPAVDFLNRCLPLPWLPHRWKPWSPSMAGEQPSELKRLRRPCMTGTYAAATLRLPLGFVNWTSAAANWASAHTLVSHINQPLRCFKPSCHVRKHTGIKVYVLALLDKKNTELGTYFSSSLRQSPKILLPVMFVKYGNSTASKYAQNEASSV